MFSIDLVMTTTKEGEKVLPTLIRHATIQWLTSDPDPVSLYTICYFLGFRGGLDSMDVVDYPHSPNTLAIIQPLDEMFHGKTSTLQMV